MKDKVICPDCGFVQDIAEFLERLEEFDEEETECANCCETIYVTWKEVSYQSYQIDLRASGRSKDFVVRTYNNQDSNKLSVEFKRHNWSRGSEFAKEPTESEFKEAVKELKEELIEAAERYYRKILQFQLKKHSKNKGEFKMTETQLTALRNARAAGAQINILGDFILRNYKEPERVKEPLEGIKRLTEELLKDVEKL